MGWHLKSADIERHGSLCGSFTNMDSFSLCNLPSDCRSFLCRMWRFKADVQLRLMCWLSRVVRFSLCTSLLSPWWWYLISFPLEWRLCWCDLGCWAYMWVLCSSDVLYQSSYQCGRVERGDLRLQVWSMSSTIRSSHLPTSQSRDPRPSKSCLLIIDFDFLISYVIVEYK